MRSRAEAQRARQREREEREESERREKSKKEWLIAVPNDPINEQVVLAAAIVDPEVRKRVVKLSPDAFYASAHKQVFLGLQALERQKLAYDPATVVRLNPEADIRTIETLAVSRPTVPPNLDFHLETLLWDRQRATVVEGPLASLIEAVQNPKEAPDRVRALARAIGEAFDQSVGASQFLRKPEEVVREMMARIRARVEGEPLFPFGIEGLDCWEEGAVNSKKEDIGGQPRIVPGAAPGMATMLTGMSGAGKTTLAAHAINGLARQGRRVLVGAWEVRAPMTLELLTVLSLGWSRLRILNGQSNRLGGNAKLTHEEMLSFEEEAHRISKCVTFIENPFCRGSVQKTGRVTNDDYLDILEEHVEMSGCEVAVFDLFDRVLRDRAPNDEQEALWRMLEFTERLQIHSVVVHQQLLKGEGVRKDMRPSIQGLKGSSAYVDAAALILAPHLPARWKKVDDNKIWIFGLKQRFGPPFAVEFDWDPDTGQIANGTTMEIDSRDDDESRGMVNHGAKGKPKPRGKW